MKFVKKQNRNYGTLLKVTLIHVILTVRRDVYSLIYFRVIHFLTG